MNAGRAVVAEFVGTAFLLAAVVGSGIMASRLCGGNVGLALLANALATGGALIALILAFGPVSGAHFNPAVTLADAWCGGVAWPLVTPYIIAQLAGALAGTGLADAMFGLPAFFASHHERSGGTMAVSEFVATFGLLAVIWGCVRSRPGATPFAGIRPLDTPLFIVAQLAGAFAATALFAYLSPISRAAARSVVVAHPEVSPVQGAAYAAHP